MFLAGRRFNENCKGPCIDICEFTGPNKGALDVVERVTSVLWDKLKPFEKKVLISRLKKKNADETKKSSGKNK